MSDKPNTMLKMLNRMPSVEIDFDCDTQPPSSVDGRIMKNMKPLPDNKNAVKVEAISLGLVGGNPSLKEPRAKLLSFIRDSMGIGRSMNHVSILLVGRSGVGKSSTINHLLGTKGEIEFAKTSDVGSKTRSTEEFVLFGEEPRYEVKDLPLGVVDTPGIGDTDSSKQEACNLLSIKKFFETHEKLSDCYPNLIFLLVSANDNRITGKNSELTKSLRIITQFNLVDPKCPNVVAILTSACSFPHVKVEKWSKKIEEKKETVSKIIFDALRVTAPVVALENHYDEEGYDLEVSGDYTRLPNGVLQPKNLYNACAAVLKKNSDHLALITLNSIFAAPKEEPPKAGHKIDATNVEKCELTAEERDYLFFLENEARGGSTDFIFDKVQEFISEGSFNRKEQEELRRTGFALKRVAYGNQQDFSTLSIAIIEYFCEGEISPIGRRMLEEKFGIATKPAKGTSDSGRLIGQGYNILADKSVAAQVMTFHGTKTEYGIVVPECAKFEKAPHTRSYMDVFETEKSYTEARLSNLNVNLTVEPNILMAGCRAGCNKVGQSSSSMSELSFLFEQRMFELKIGNYEEYLSNETMSFTRDFESNVEKLPSTYDQKDSSCRSTFEKFFNRFGHFLVSAAYGGGSVELKCSRESIGTTSTSVVEAKAHLIATFQQVGGPIAEVSSSTSSSGDLHAETLLSRCMESWKGGDILLHAKETIADKDKMHSWKVSLLGNPTMLTSEVTLEPISTAVACVDKEKEDAAYDALKDLLGGEFKTLAEMEKAGTVEEYRKRMEAINTKIGTIEQPKVKDSCFPSSSVVNVASKDGVKTQKKMADLGVGEKVMAWDEKRNRAVFTEVIMFAHRETDAKDVKYLKITLEDGTKITLSGTHLVMVGKHRKAIMAQTVKLGDTLFTVDENQEISPKRVSSIVQVIELGVFCPITSHGNVIVDNVLASCYASTQDHIFLQGLVKVSAQRLAHLGLMPMRVLHKLRLKWLRKIPNDQGIHPYLQWLCKLKLPFMAN